MNRKFWPKTYQCNPEDVGLVFFNAILWMAEWDRGKLYNARGNRCRYCQDSMLEVYDALPELDLWERAWWVCKYSQGEYE